MAAITKVCRKSGYAYKAVIRLRGIKPFSKTFKLRKDAKAWSERMERNIEEARAHGNDYARTLTLKELVGTYIHQYTGKNHSAYSCLQKNYICKTRFLHTLKLSKRTRFFLAR